MSGDKSRYRIRRVEPGWLENIGRTILQLLDELTLMSGSDRDGSCWEVLERDPTTGVEVIVFESNDQYEAQRKLAALRKAEASGSAP